MSDTDNATTRAKLSVLRELDELVESRTDLHWTDLGDDYMAAVAELRRRYHNAANLAGASPKSKVADLRRPLEVLAKEVGVTLENYGGRIYIPERQVVGTPEYIMGYLDGLLVPSPRPHSIKGAPCRTQACKGRIDENGQCHTCRGFYYD